MALVVMLLMIAAGLFDCESAVVTIAKGAADRLPEEQMNTVSAIKGSFDGE